MLIAISGTPGTGKTVVGKILSKSLGAKLVTTDYIIKKYKITTSFDRKRRTKIVDVKRLATAVKKEAKKRPALIFEGHLSHFVPADLTIILRTSPSELERRLKRKNWSQKKIKENVEAEAIGLISKESVKRKSAVELDTTGKTPKTTVAMILKLLNSYSLQKRYSVGKIDWTEKFSRYLIKNG